jgi:hypothetical protein
MLLRFELSATMYRDAKIESNRITVEYLAHVPNS